MSVFGRRSAKGSPKTIAHFGLGFCNNGTLKGHVAVAIHNRDGELVGYAGRIPGVPKEGQGKYKIPKDFKKSVEIFNLRRALASEDESPFEVVQVGKHGGEKFYDDKRLALVKQFLSEVFP